MRLRTWFVVIGLSWVGIGCNNEPSVLGVAYSDFDKDYGVVLLDTLTVAVSTVLLDSIPTSGTSTMLVGGYSDDKLGKLQAEGYLQIGTGDTWQPEEDAVFDSLVLIATYSGYHYGDTTTAQTFEVRQIAQDFKTYSLPQFWVDERQYSALYTTGSLYNSSALRYGVSPLGSRTIRVRPGSQDSLVIRLKDTLGQDWLQLAQNKSTTFTDETAFLEYFKGIAILNTSPQPTCVMGFSTEDLRLRLYYKTFVNDVFEQKYYEFPYSSDLYQYSRIISDRSGTIVENLTQENNELSTYETEDVAFIQSGTGIATKVSLPYVNKMIDLKNILIVNQAQLIIEPVKNSFSQNYPLPISLTLFETDKSNLPLNQLYADYSSETGQSAYISFDKEFDTSTGYIFTITQYIQSMLSTEGNLQRGLLIMSPSNEINTTVNRVYLGAGRGASYKVKLKIWYTQRQ